MHSLQIARYNAMIRWQEVPGADPAIICLPGMSMFASLTFQPLLLQPMFKGRRAMLIDYLGSGFSDHPAGFGYSLVEHAETIAAVLDHVGINSAVVLGHSMGGSVGIALAKARPDLVSNLIVCEGNVTPGGGGASGRYARASRAEFLNDIYPRTLAKLREKALTGDKGANALVASWIAASPAGIHGNAVGLSDLPDGFMQDFLTLPIPRHFVYGEHTFPEGMGEITADTPDPEVLREHGVGVHVVQGTGHNMMIDDVRAFAGATADIL